MDPPRHCLIGDEIVPEAEARVSARDRGLLYGDGLFETLRVYGGHPFRLQDHWRRLTASAGFLEFPLPPTRPEEAVARLLAANGMADGVIRITVTRGTDPPGPRPKGPGGVGADQPTLIGQVRPVPGDLASRAANGIPGRRLPWPLRGRGNPLHAHKTLTYLSSVLALGIAEAGEEPLLENTEGHLAEGATTNLFWVRSGILRTPRVEAGCLPGIARALVLELARRSDIPTAEGFWAWSDLVEADEAFVTNSVTEVLPLIRLDGRPLAAGRPGPVTRSLQAAYRSAVQEETGG